MADNRRSPWSDLSQQAPRRVRDKRQLKRPWVPPYTDVTGRVLSLQERQEASRAKLAEGQQTLEAQRLGAQTSATKGEQEERRRGNNITLIAEMLRNPDLSAEDQDYWRAELRKLYTSSPTQPGPAIMTAADQAAADQAKFFRDIGVAEPTVRTLTRPASETGVSEQRRQAIEGGIMQGRLAPHEVVNRDAGRTVFKSADEYAAYIAAKKQQDPTGGGTISFRDPVSGQLVTVLGRGTERTAPQTAGYEAMLLAHQQRTLGLPAETVLRESEERMQEARPIVGPAGEYAGAAGAALQAAGGQMGPAFVPRTMTGTSIPQPPVYPSPYGVPVPTLTPEQERYLRSGMTLEEAQRTYVHPPTALEFPSQAQAIPPAPVTGPPAYNAPPEGMIQLAPGGIAVGRGEIAGGVTPAEALAVRSQTEYEPVPGQPGMFRLRTPTAAEVRERGEARDITLARRQREFLAAPESPEMQRELAAVRAATPRRPAQAVTEGERKRAAAVGKALPTGLPSSPTTDKDKAKLTEKMTAYADDLIRVGQAFQGTTWMWTAADLNALGDVRLKALEYLDSYEKMTDAQRAQFRTILTDKMPAIFGPADKLGGFKGADAPQSTRENSRKTANTMRKWFGFPEIGRE